MSGHAPNADEQHLMTPKLWAGFAAAAAIVLLLAWFAGFLTPGKIRPGSVPLPEATASQAPTAQVRVDEVPVMYEAVGTVGSRAEVEIASKVMASVLEVTVTTGATVRRGDVLVRLDARDMAARLREAQASVGAARAELERSKANYERFEGLLKRGAATQKEFEDVSAAYHVAQSRLEAAEQGLTQARVALGYTEIAAPLDGVVAAKLVEAGDLAVPGKPLLRLHDPQQLRIEAAVREALASRLEIGAPVTVRIDALGKEFATRIDEIIPRADPATRSITVRASLPAGQGLQPGMFGRLLYPAGSVRVLLVPRSAVQHVGQLDSVRVLTDAGARTRQVQVGKPRNGDVEILAGLQAGETVLLTADGRHE